METLPYSKRVRRCATHELIKSLRKLEGTNQDRSLVALAEFYGMKEYSAKGLALKAEESVGLSKFLYMYLTVGQGLRTSPKADRVDQSRPDADSDD